MELNKDMNSGLRMGTTTRFSQAIKLSVLAMGALAVAQAAPITISNYSGPNGEGVAINAINPDFNTTKNYWDKNYTGTAVPNTSTDLAPLSGGVGDLTDGVIPNLHWFSAGLLPVAESALGTGPYVGWFSVDPTITFQFANGYNNNLSITLYFDDTDNSGSVALPASVDVTGRDPILNLPTTFSFPVTEGPAVAGPKAVTLTLPSIFITQAVDIKIFRQNTLNTPNPTWIMLGEAQFAGVEVPETGTWAALGLGAVALVQVGRRARASRK